MRDLDTSGQLTGHPEIHNGSDKENTSETRTLKQPSHLHMMSSYSTPVSSPESYRLSNMLPSRKPSYDSWQDLSISKALSPPSLNHYPDRSFSKKMSCFSPTGPRNYGPVDTSALPTREGPLLSIYSHSSLSQNLDDLSLERFDVGTQLTIDQTSFSTANVYEPQKNPEVAEVFSHYTTGDKGKNFCDKDKNSSVEPISNCEAPKSHKMPLLGSSSVDYWSNSKFNRLNRKNPHIKEILDVNKRETKPIELIKIEQSTLLVVELCCDCGETFAKCYVAGDFSLKMIIVSSYSFPCDKAPPLGSLWRSSIEHVCPRSSYRRMEFLRVPFNKLIEFGGMMKSSYSTRTIQFGNKNSSFYCEMLQICLPLTYVCNKSEETLSGCYGEVTFSRSVVPQVPYGTMIVEGHGWIEPKPGAICVIKEPGCYEPWLLIEPFNSDRTRNTHLEEELRKANNEACLDQEFATVKSKGNKILQLREKGFIAYPKRVPSTKLKANTENAKSDKGGRQDACEQYMMNILQRGTKAPDFRNEKIQELFDLVQNRDKKSARLGQLCSMFLPYLEDETAFNYLKKSEPRNLEDLRAIIRLTLDYASGRRDRLSRRAYNFLFPISDDDQEWAD